MAGASKHREHRRLRVVCHVLLLVFIEFAELIWQQRHRQRQRQHHQLKSSKNKKRMGKRQTKNKREKENRTLIKLRLALTGSPQSRRTRTAPAPPPPPSPAAPPAVALHQFKSSAVARTSKLLAVCLASACLALARGRWPAISLIPRPCSVGF